MNTPPPEKMSASAPIADTDFAPGASSPKKKILGKGIKGSEAATGDNVVSPDALTAAKLAAATLSDSSIPPITTTSAPADGSRTHRKMGGTISPVSPIFPGRSSRGSSPPRAHRHPLVGSSPKLSATLDESQIFERNVQDPSLPPPSSPAIPAHIQTENYIPPVLEATSLAITDPNVNPDFVEIVSTTTHEPALGGSDAYASPMSEDTPMTLSGGIASPSSTAADDGLGNQEISDAEKRRLSFISFADVVHAEQAEMSQSTDGLGSHSPPRQAHSPPTVPVTGVSPSAVAAAQAAMHHRTPSPIRSIGSSTGSPPPGLSGLGVGSMDKEKARNPVHSELTVETLSQALRRHGSGDLGAASRSHPISATEEHPPNAFKDKK